MFTCRFLGGHEFHFSQIYINLTRCMVSALFSFVRNHNLFHSICTILHCNQQCMRLWDIKFLIIPWTIFDVSFFFLSHSNRYVVISYYGFNLHFPNVQSCWTPLHMLLCHLKCLFTSFAHFLNELFSFIVEFKFFLDESFVRYAVCKCFPSF